MSAASKDNPLGLVHSSEFGVEKGVCTLQKGLRGGLLTQLRAAQVIERLMALPGVSLAPATQAA